MSEEEFNYPKDPERALNIKKAHEVWRTKGVHIVSEDEQSVFVSSSWPSPRSRPHPVPKNVFVRLYRFGHYESA
jgi:hypothetical protein